MNGVYDRQWRASLSMLAIGVGLALMTLLALGTTAALAADASTDAANEAHVVVQLDGTDLLVRPITFTESISGFRALQLSGLDFAYSTEYGPPLVCSIEGVGCPADDCFCDPDGKFWAYSQWNGSDWEPSMVGAGSSVISQTGAVEGWRWGRRQRALGFRRAGAGGAARPGGDPGGPVDHRRQLRRLDEQQPGGHACRRRQ